MAASSKRRFLDSDLNKPKNGNSTSSSECDEMKSDEEDALATTNIQVEFEARTPTDSDYHGIKGLLQQLFPKARLNLGDLTNLLLEQNYVSSVIQQSETIDMDVDSEEDDAPDDIFGIVSVINITEKKDVKCVKDIVDFLLESCKNQSSSENLKKFSSVLGDSEQQIGLLLSERFVNIPPNISLPLFRALKQDMSAAVEKGKKFKFGHYILISKILKNKKPKKQTSDDMLIYTNAEEELLNEEAELTFEYTVENEMDTALGGKWEEGDDEFKPYRRVMLFSAEKLDLFIDKLEKEFPGN